MTCADVVLVSHFLGVKCEALHTGVGVKKKTRIGIGPLSQLIIRFSKWTNSGPVILCNSDVALVVL